MAALLTSCPAETTDFINLFLNKDRVAPKLVEYDFLDNELCVLTFDERVEITDASCDGKKVYYSSSKARMVNLTLSEPLKAGEGITLFFSVMDSSENSSRFALKLTGINLNQAEMLITEISVKGTKENPDRIELTATEPGSSLGYVIQDGIIGYEKHAYHLPDIELRKNDIIVIYWDRCESLPSTLYRDGEKTYYLYAKSTETLIGTNGAIVLYNHTNGNGKIEDALLYNTRDAENNDGYGNLASEMSAKYLIEIGQWSGETFKSDQITSSRVAARYYPYEDNNCDSDFYITAARNSTFGYPNTNIIYEP